MSIFTDLYILIEGVHLTKNSAFLSLVTFYTFHGLTAACLKFERISRWFDHWQHKCKVSKSKFSNGPYNLRIINGKDVYSHQNLYPSWKAFFRKFRSQGQLLRKQQFVWHLMAIRSSHFCYSFSYSKRKWFQEFCT